MQDLDKLSIRSSTISVVPRVKKREEELHVHFSESDRTDNERVAKWNTIAAPESEALTGGVNSFTQKNVLHPVTHTTRSSVSTGRQHLPTTSTAKKGSDSRYYAESSAPFMMGEQIPGRHGSS